ncbi:MAG: ribosome assembly RNA-binding protein YhbY [Erysipelotrichia bacterium]|nr:ribosome assembly RNA-binding protein YhbY [Erysipelotrichia bacterium]
MLTKTQKKYLKSMTNTLKPIVLVGKNGITSTVIDSVDEALTANELVKISLSENCPQTADEAAIELASETGSEIVYQIGRKITLYRRNLKKNIINLPR